GVAAVAHARHAAGALRRAQARAVAHARPGRAVPLPPRALPGRTALGRPGRRHRVHGRALPAREHPRARGDRRGHGPGAAAAGALPVPALRRGRAAGTIRGGDARGHGHPAHPPDHVHVQPGGRGRAGAAALAAAARRAARGRARGRGRGVRLARAAAVAGGTLLLSLSFVAPILTLRGFLPITTGARSTMDRYRYLTHLPSLLAPASVAPIPVGSPDYVPNIHVAIVLAAVTGAVLAAALLLGRGGAPYRVPPRAWPTSH